MADNHPMHEWDPDTREGIIAFCEYQLAEAQAALALVDPADSKAYKLAHLKIEYAQGKLTTMLDRTPNAIDMPGFEWDVAEQRAADIIATLEMEMSE